MVSGMDLTKASHISHIGTFILTGALFLLAIWPLPWTTPKLGKVWLGMPVSAYVLAACLMLLILMQWRASVAKATQQGNIPETSSSQFFSILDEEPSRQPADTVTYKFKLYVILRNDSGQYFETVSGAWEPGDIGVSLSNLLWQIEGSGGWQTGSWQPEQRGEIRNVAPNQLLRTWIPLITTTNDAEVRRRIVQRRLGTLVIRSRAAGGTLEAQQIQL
jgi:hypothetical protein